MSFLADCVERASSAMPNHFTALSHFGVAVRFASEKEPEKAGAYEKGEHQELDGGGPFAVLAASFDGQVKGVWILIATLFN